jgi:hypothetical protein
VRLKAHNKTFQLGQPFNNWQKLLIIYFGSQVIMVAAIKSFPAQMSKSRNPASNNNDSAGTLPASVAKSWPHFVGASAVPAPTPVCGSGRAVAAALRLAAAIAPTAILNGGAGY